MGITMGIEMNEEDAHELLAAMNRLGIKYILRSCEEVDYSDE